MLATFGSFGGPKIQICGSIPPDPSLPPPLQRGPPPLNRQSGQQHYIRNSSLQKCWLRTPLNIYITLLRNRYKIRYILLCFRMMRMIFVSRNLQIGLDGGDDAQRVSCWPFHSSLGFLGIL